MSPDDLLTRFVSLLLQTAQHVVDRVWALRHEFVSPESRWFVGYLLVTAAIAGGLYLADRAGQARSWREFLGWLAPRRVYAHASFRVDVGLILTNQVLMPGVWLAEGLALRELDETIIAHGRTALDGPWLSADPGLSVTLAIGLIVFCVYDFGMYLHHLVMHKVPLLWEIHRVHHSAEEMNPLTGDRFHPLEEVIKSLIMVPLVGCAVGAMGIAFDVAVVNHGFELVKVWLYVQAFSMVGANLRHMHVWWSWPTPLARIVSSPAQHQIHHSIAKQHYGKNLGSFLSLWDWLFGTLYQPQGRETLRFGVAEGQDHSHLGAALWHPFEGMCRVLRGRRIDPAVEPAAPDIPPLQ